jgi:hypothetical protein
MHNRPTGAAVHEAAHLVFDKPVDGIWLSDHFGVVVDLEVGTDRAG